jgi:hypothetical protein
MTDWVDDIAREDVSYSSSSFPRYISLGQPVCSTERSAWRSRLQPATNNSLSGVLPQAGHSRLTSPVAWFYNLSQVHASRVL